MVHIQTFRFTANGKIPNNPNLSLVIFKNVLPPTDNRERACQFLFKRNDWCGIWANGVLDYHHYHSTSHEALGIVAGSARILFGGENGKVIDVAVGDVVILPAGVGHCCVDASGDFQVVGAYPCGQENWDLCTGEDDCDEALRRVLSIALPKQDPVHGSSGILFHIWKQAS